MEKLRQEIKKIVGITISDEQLKALLLYEKELIHFNQKFNLTAVCDEEGIRVKHFLDSLTCLLALDLKTPKDNLIDIGTGAGFPGIPIKIMLPHIKLCLVESNHKKANFCQHIARMLNLKNVNVIAERVETIGHDPIHRQVYDVAVARAVATTPTLVEYLLPLVKVGGIAILQKGENAHLEVHNAQKAINILGGQIKRIIPVLLPGVVEERFLVVIDKVAVTSEKYPRKVGFPSKYPLI
jgi:16S rRNA (guanine527-N7)-methyltransferase